MSGRIVALLAWAVLAGLIVPAAAQKDDKAEKFPAPPADYDKKRYSVERSELGTIQVVATMVGGRWMHNPPPWD